MEDINKINLQFVTHDPDVVLGKNWGLWTWEGLSLFLIN